MFKSIRLLTRPWQKEQEYIFPSVNPKIDGPDCLRDCEDCSVSYPRGFKVETSRELYGNVKSFTTHVLVGTGKSDWASHVEHEKGSLMQAFSNSSGPKSGRLMISASNFTAPESTGENDAEISGWGNKEKTTILLLPSFTFVDSVGPSDVPDIITSAIDKEAIPRQLSLRPCGHSYIILLCSHKRRDARCGQSAPLLKKEFERHLRPLNLYRDSSDERPGGVGIYFVSHVGGHKFSANVLVYRKDDQQMIWLARVRPEHCEGIISYTVLKGKVVHPETQLRGGADWKNGLTSW